MCSAMTLQYADDGLISDRHLAFYRERASGGVALLFSEQLTATPISGSPFASAIAAYDERQVKRFAAIAKTLRPYQTRFFAQLFAGGVVADGTLGLDEWGPVRGPSRIGGSSGAVPVPLEPDELAQIAADFALSADHVRAGSLDGVEVHGSHGWLVGQFLSPFYNRRDDRYGGSVANRCRLALEIGRAIRSAVGPTFPVGLSLSYDEMIGKAGITPEDTLGQLEVLSAEGVYDFFDLSIGSEYSEHFTIAPMDVEEGFALGFSARAKAAVGDRAAIFVAGRIVDPFMAARAIRDGAADMVAMSRAHLADAHLVHKALSGRAHEIRRCVGANVCVGRSLKGRPATCVLTPATGREAQWGAGSLRPLDDVDCRRVVVIGGGPAGLRAGAVAAARGHEVVVHEQEAEPGGHLRDIGWLPTRQNWRRAVEDLVSELHRAGGRLVLGSPADAGVLERTPADVILVATGADWDTSGNSGFRPEQGIPGVETGRVLGLGTALRATQMNARSLGQRVVIVDETGEYAPLGLAEALAVIGVSVQLVTPHRSIGSLAAERLETPHVLPRLRRLGVSFTVAHDVAAIRGATVELVDIAGGMPRVLHDIDSVVLAMRRLPRDDLYLALDRAAREVRRIGDALAPRTTAAVIHEAEAVARAI
jgi:2,4-dienoyl-CoA reductase-like NADH-dependent reductase (Old Yellow Enzyme family)